jgi:hypothetical protein
MLLLRPILGFPTAVSARFDRSSYTAHVRKGGAGCEGWSDNPASVRKEQDKNWDHTNQIKGSRTNRSIISPYKISTLEPFLVVADPCILIASWRGEKQRSLRPRLQWLGDCTTRRPNSMVQTEVQRRQCELNKALVCSDCRTARIIGFQIKHSDFLVILFLQKVYRYISYINNERNPRLHLSPPREASPLTYNIMFHKNSSLLQGSKIISCCCKSVRITGSSSWRGFTLLRLHCIDYRRFIFSGT